MGIYTLNFVDLKYFSTNDPDGFNSNNGQQLQPNSSTITMAHGAMSQPVSISDNDAYFDDDDHNQKLNGAQTIGGHNWASGTMIESEYVVTVKDAAGHTYRLQAVSMNNNAWTTYGFVIQGNVPPAGQALTVVSSQDVVQGQDQFSTSAQVTCFAASVMIAAGTGPLPAGRLRPGDPVRLADGGCAPVRLVLRSQWRGEPETERNGPVRIAAGALGNGLPHADLILSPQHRVCVTLADGEALVPARALVGQRGIAPLTGHDAVDYVHIVLDRHALVLAEGAPCESFWPGPVAMGTLAAAVRARIHAIMGPEPRPARRLLAVQPARRLLALA